MEDLSEVSGKKGYLVSQIKLGFWEKLKFTSLVDDRGDLIAIESRRTIPFQIERVYYLYATEADARRGFHAHYDLEQVLISVSGSCKVLVNDGKNKEIFLLDKPDTGLLIKNLIWREMFDFSPDCVLLVLANDHFRESDYIRDYQQFLNKVNEYECS